MLINYVFSIFFPRTIDLGWRLSSCEWWRAVCASSTALNYIELRLKNADRVELTWLRQLRTPERVDVSELFLRSTYVRYGGHFLKLWLKKCSSLTLVFRIVYTYR